MDLHYAHRRHPIAEDLTVSSVAITNEEPGSLVPGDGFGNLLSCPLGRWVRGDTEVDHFPLIVARDDEHEEDLEGQGGDDKEIDGSHAK